MKEELYEDDYYDHYEEKLIHDRFEKENPSILRIWVEPTERYKGRFKAQTIDFKAAYVHECERQLYLWYEDEWDNFYNEDEKPEVFKTKEVFKITKREWLHKNY